MSRHRYNNLLKITGIFEKDKTTPKESHQYRIGRTGKISNLNTGTPLCFEYSDGHGILVTSNVVDYEEDSYGVWIETGNTSYRLDDVFEENSNTKMFNFNCIK